MDKIKAKIQELCPDVMELKFGCEVEIDFGSLGGKQSAKVVSTQFAPKLLVQFQEDVINAYEYKILGSPITIAVVLRAIPVAYLTRGDNGQVFIKIRDVAYRPNDGGCEWNLLKNYDDQTKETQQCIGQLLGVNE